MSDTDTERLDRARACEPGALAEIYDHFSTQLYAYAMRQLGDEQIAEDCVAETFTRFLKAVAAGGGPKDYLQAYLYRTAHNWICDQFRRRPVLDPLEDELVDVSSTSPEEDIEQAIFAKEMRSALRLLTDEQRQVVVLRFFEGWSHPEIAQAMDRPVGAVKALQHRALRSLERVLTKRERQAADVS